MRKKIKLKETNLGRKIKHFSFEIKPVNVFHEITIQVEMRLIVNSQEVFTILKLTPPDDFINDLDFFMLEAKMALLDAVNDKLGKYGEPE